MSRPKPVTLVGWVLAALLCALYLLLKSYGLNPDVGDEAIYFYDATATAAGKLPYRDYPLAHPPLQILLLVPLFALLGPSYALGKLVPPLLTLFSALLVLRIARRSWMGWPGAKLRSAATVPESPGGASVLPREEWIAWAAGLAALALYVLSYDVLRCSTHYTGANLGTLLALASLERSLAGRPAQGGVLAALAGLTGFYAAPAPVAAAALLHARRPRQLLRFVVAAGGLFLGANLLCLAVAGRAFLDQVYLFHLAKPAHEGGNLPLWHALARDNLLLVASGGLGALLCALHLTVRLLGRYWPRAWGSGAPGQSGAIGGQARSGQTRAEARRARRKEGKLAARATQPGRPAQPDQAGPPPDQGARWPDQSAWPDRSLIAPCACLVALLLHALAVLALSRVYTYYFAPGYPLLALLGGHAAGWVAVALLAAERLPGTAVDLPRLRHLVWYGGAGLLSCFFAALLVLPALLEPTRPADQGRVKRYRWFEQTRLPAIDPLVRRLLWQDERKLDQRYGSLVRYLWHESRYSEAAPQLAEQVSRSSAPGDLLFGDSMTAPLIALLTNRRLAGDMADTNRQHYWSGVRSAAQDVARLDGPALRFVICRGRVGICGEPAVWEWLNRDFRLAARIPDTRQGLRLYLYERIR